MKKYRLQGIESAPFKPIEFDGFKKCQTIQSCRSDGLKSIATTYREPTALTCF